MPNSVMILKSPNRSSQGECKRLNDKMYQNSRQIELNSLKLKIYLVVLNENIRFSLIRKIYNRHF